MTNKLIISPDLSLDLDAITKTFGILARKGSGKSYTASVFAEEMLERGEQVVIIDPTGAWFGLQSSADGKKAGYPIVVFGGDNGNVPLDKNSGEILAKAIVEKGFSAILDLSLMRKGEANYFIGIFLETLYQKNREAMHLFIDEGDLFAPQKPYGDQYRTLGAMEDIVRRGRKRGIGCTLISQRPQVLNKDVLTQVEALMVMCLSHPKDIAAINDWVKVHADQSQAKKMEDSLPSLPKGTGWFWSPGDNIFKRVKVRTRKTFDSGATPKPGERVRVPQKLSQIDIQALGASITEIVTKQKEEDPRLLKAEIKRLQLELTQIKNSPLKPSAGIKGPDPAILNDLRENVKAHRDEADAFYKIIKDAHETFERLKKLCANGPGIPERKKIRAIVAKDAAGKFHTPPNAGSFRENSIKIHSDGMGAQGSLEALTKPYLKYRSSTSTSKGSEIIHIDADHVPGPNKCERAILVVLAEREGSSTTNRQAGILSGYSYTSGSFRNSMSSLRSRGWAEGSGEDLKITDLGMQVVGEYTPMPTGEALHEYWYKKLNLCERTILQHLISVGGMAQSREQIAEATGYAYTSGSFRNSMSTLRTLSVIEGYKDETRASAFLFED